MACYVLIIKEEDQPDYVVYRFGPDEEVFGRLKFEKEKQTFTLLNPIPDASLSTDFFLHRACQKIAGTYAASHRFPERMVYSS